ncbi:hypothetical protein D3C78_687840 [compost metagenome]
MVLGTFVNTLFLHDLEDHRQVQRHDRNGRAGLGDHRLEHGYVGATADFFAQALGGLVQILLGLAKGAVPVDRPGDLGADVAEGHGAGLWRQYASGVQGIDPQFPVLATHDGHGVGNFLFGSRLDGRLDDGVFVGVDSGRLVRLADWLERRTHQFASLWQLAHRRSQRVDHQIDLAAHFVLDQFDDLGPCFVGEGVTVDRLAVQAFGLGELVEGRGVVPAGGAWLGLGARLFEEHTQGVGTEAERCGDARRQAVAAGGTDHQDLLRTILAHALLAGGFDLITYVQLATGRMRSGADKTANFRVDDGQCLYLVSEYAEGAESRGLEVPLL